jgi:hypothetical protein
MTKLEAASQAHRDYFNNVYQPAKRAYLVTHAIGDAEYMPIRAKEMELLAVWNALDLGLAA